MSAIKAFIRLTYLGFVMARQHAVSYIAYIINAVFWLLLVMLPSAIYSRNPHQFVVLFLPAYVAMMVASTGASSAFEFLSWYVYQGLTDVYREAGLGVYHYLVSSHVVDFLISLTSYFLLAFIVGSQIGLEPAWFLRVNPLYFSLLFPAAVAVETFFGGLVAVILTTTRIGTGFYGFLLMLLSITAYTPLWLLPSPLLGFLSPAVLVAELLRASYGYSTIPGGLLLGMALLLILVYYFAGYAMCKLADKTIAKYGIEFRM
ncbi:MAG: hypothetical protein ACP5KA_00665 [Desulfurococcaceae archaeon]